MMFARSLVVGITLAALQGAPVAASKPASAETRLSRCGTETCLLVTGRRSDAAAPIRLAGRAIVVEGSRTWRVAVPLEMVRTWSAPFARSIAVQIGEDVVQARLPTGLLGHVSNLALLEVHASH